MKYIRFYFDPDKSNLIFFRFSSEKEFGCYNLQKRAKQNRAQEYSVTANKVTKSLQLVKGTRYLPIKQNNPSGFFAFDTTKGEDPNSPLQAETFKDFNQGKNLKLIFNEKWDQDLPKVYPANIKGSGNIQVQFSKRLVEEAELDNFSNMEVDLSAKDDNYIVLQFKPTNHKVGQLIIRSKKGSSLLTLPPEVSHQFGVAPSIPDHLAGSFLFHLPPELPRG